MSAKIQYSDWLQQLQATEQPAKAKMTWTEQEIKRVQQARGQGYTQSQIAKAMGVTLNTIRGVCDRCEIRYGRPATLSPALPADQSTGAGTAATPAARTARKR